MSKLRFLIMGLMVGGILASLAMPTVSLIPSSMHLLFVGNIDLKRDGLPIYKSVKPFKRLYPADSIRLGSGKQATILCSELRLRAVPSGTNPVSKVCPPSKQDRLRRGQSDVAAPRGGSNPLIPYLISPRQTQVLSPTPVLRWNGVPNATEYRVYLRSPTGIIWEETVKETEIVYPGEPVLQAEVKYAVVVEANTGAKSIDEGIAGLAFSVFPQRQVEQVRRDEITLNQEGLPQEGKVLALAHLYRSYGLMAKAIETLEMFVKQGEATSAIYQLLGDCYRQVRLNLKAKDAYVKAVELINEEDIESKAQIQVALAQVYIVLKEKEQAVVLLRDAKVGYENLGDLQEVKKLEQQLEEWE